ncbi:MAG: hypothetical protein ACREEH_03275, partial [Caulobacteraceae bacterium]
MEAQGLKPPRLCVLPARHREIHRPLLEFIEKLDVDTPGRSVAVFIPEMVLRSCGNGFSTTAAPSGCAG